ncbi:protein FAM184A-like isoform X4 [Onychostoma macrolepis]|uniref:protein FAM184A-like isoform X4 n=1 Tax=Onychostoma macrolepis TaxID=369639 RepID=UPI002729A2B4|nr:protein FAM184A-like isoform X4 [Onychostoma macrolepis]XP_058604535.1 protein FAM184A-like isoform X4 [Onychostoma macrolepis]
MATGTGWQPPYSAAPGINPPAAAAAASGSGTSPSSTSSHLLYESALTMEYTQDLHLKMSKKIAQLTKVIYALNTKNDEHEDAIQSLKEAHDEEVQHILTEAREKIFHYKSKIGDEADLKRRLQSLEESVELHEHMKRQALAEFEMYRQRVEDTQLCTEAQHTQRVVSMSREVEEMRHEFEEKLRSFSQVQAQFEQEKRRALEELKSVHRQEVQELLESQQNQSASSSLEQEKLAELHRSELESLMERVEELTQDKVRLVEEYEAKLSKAQGFYERELEAMRRTQQLTTENLLAWKRTEVELRKEFQVQESALQRTLCKLRVELHRAQDEARESRDKTNRLQASLNNAEVTITELHKQLEEAIQDGEIWVMQLKDTEYELEGSRDRVQQQANEILHKASQIGSLQATQMSHEATIRDLGSEQNRLKEKILQLEEERERLQKQIQTLEEQQHQKILNLEKSLCEEKQKYEMELARIRAKYEEETACLKESQAESLEELKEKHRVQQESARNAAEREKNQLLSEMRQQFDIRRLSLEEQRNHLQQQLETMREELTTKLNMANQEVSHLKDLVKESEKNMDTAENHISCLKDSQEKLLMELDATRARVRETSNLLTDLQEEIETQKQQHEARVISIKTEEKQKMDKITEELDLKWTDALRAELKGLREELTAEHQAEKQVALTQLSQQRDLEMMAARESWQRKVEDLLEQISLLKQSLELQMSQSKSALQQLQAQFSQEREHLAQQVQELALEHQHRECRLQEAHCCSMQDMDEAQQIELRELEERLKQEQREELHALRDAHRQTLEILRQQSDQELQTLRFELEDEGKAMLASLRSELNHLHASAIEHLRQVHLKENNAAKRELDDTIERCKEHEQDLLGRISDLRQEVSCRKNRIADLDHEIHSLNETISTLTKELEHKGKEVLRVRSEANLHIRAHEQDLSKRLEREIDELNASHNRETQIMLSDFNKAQELLRDKISALQILLEGTEEKFRNRESRPEDLQVIAELREMVSERESLVKKLVDDKKFYQLELVNREPGFNKVFNTNPNVGVINPLIKHKSRKPANTFASSPNLSVVAAEGMAGGSVPPACLESAPNSPIHHHELRSNKPPPPPTPPPQADSTRR